MGGFRKYMPFTFGTMFVGWLAISGFPLLSGFFSKDEILWKTWSTEALPTVAGFPLSKILWGIAALTALLTAIYMTRMMVMTFWGEERFGKSHGDDHGHASHGHDDHGHGGHGHGKPHESGWLMVAPLVILAVLSAVGGFVGVPAAMGGSNHFEHFLEPVIAHAQPHGAAAGHGAATAEQAAVPAVKAEEHHDTSTELALAGFSILLGLIGIAVGFAVFGKNPLKKMPKILEDKYKVDELYDEVVVTPIETLSREGLWKVIDVKIIDGAVNGTARLFGSLSGILRYTQTGFARNYAAVILVGAIVVIGYFGYIALR